MERGQKAKGRELVEAGDRAAPGDVGAVSAPARAATVSVQNAAKQQRINWGLRVMSKNVLNAAQL